jgi:hypothetical protein
MRHSERSSFNNCPLRFKLEHDGLRRVQSAYNPNAEDRTFGQAIHEGLKAHYDGKSWDEIVAAYSSLYPVDKEYKTMAKSHESGIFLLQNYRTYWSEQDKLWEVIGTEVADTIHFNDEDHSLHIDLLAKNKQTGEIWAWDHKTTEKNLGKGFWKKYELDAQITRYTKFVMDKYGSCGGFIINGMSFGHRQRMYKGEPAGFHQEFDRQPFSRNTQQIKFWEESEKDWASLIEHCQVSGSWPKHLGSLCSWCDYYELCMSANNESVRETLYTTEPLSEEEAFTITDETT